ncbi:MAG: 1-acyl-sn-glycerol-3-phosphate acyltransferase [Bacteroidales bacterium]|nr:1-acyl-sn-glycerol-3-phosphate acyltransferase [Bacteroidales bacterium]
MNEKVVIGKKFIDIPKLIKEKSPTLYKRLPNFLIRLLERIVHVDGFNYYIYKWRDEFGVNWAKRAIKDFEVEITVTGVENIPKSGNQMVVANHPLGGFDGIAMMAIIAPIRPDIKAPVNDILLKLPGMKPMLVPINKHAKDTKSLKLLNAAFASDDMLLFFPAGLVSRKQKEGIRDLEWKHAFIAKSVEYKRDVIPTFIDAYNSNFFYNFAYWRKKLGIKSNIEMIFLPGEVFKQKKSKIAIHFGKPISYATFDETKSKRKWALWVRNHVYEIGVKQGVKLK